MMTNMYKALLQRPILNGFFSIVCLFLGCSVVALTVPESIAGSAAFGLVLACFLIPGSLYGTYFKEKMPKMKAFLYCLTLLSTIFTFAFFLSLQSPEVLGDIQDQDVAPFLGMFAAVVAVIAGVHIALGYFMIRKISGTYAKIKIKQEAATEIPLNSDLS